jgi:hypothetical protein
MYFGVPVAKLPLLMKRIDKVKCPEEIFLRRTTPNGDGVIFVRRSINGVTYFRREYAHGRTKHLNSFQQYFMDMFVHHELRTLHGQER